MARYKYSAISQDGQKVSGVVEGYNELDAVAAIKQSCSIVLKISEIQEGKESFLTRDLGANRLNTKAFTVMCSQFAIILRSGIPVARAVHLVEDKVEDKPLRRLLERVAEDVEAGRSLASSFEDRGAKLLPVTFIETVRAGEESGNIAQSFDTMAKHFDKSNKRRSKVRGALAYPVFVLVVAVIVVAVLMGFVVPRFTRIFDSYGSEMPGVTRALIAVSSFFRDYILVIVVAVALIILFFKLYGNTEGGRLRLAKLGLRLPILGKINTLNAASQFANSMTAMLDAGLPMTRAISITANVIDNYYISQEIGKLSEKLEQGHSLGGSMRESGCMPEILTDMVSVGEETGEMAETLGTIAEYYDTELETAVSSALAKLEPALLVTMAAIAGFVVISIYIAMFQMYAVM